MLETSKTDKSNIIDVEEFNKRFQEWIKNYAEFIQEIGKISEENKISLDPFLNKTLKKTLIIPLLNLKILFLLIKNLMTRLTSMRIILSL